MSVAHARRTASRASASDSDAVLVAALTLVASAVAIWDLLLLALSL
jgi:hypothetical protein